MSGSGVGGGLPERAIRPGPKRVGARQARHGVLHEDELRGAEDFLNGSGRFGGDDEIAENAHADGLLWEGDGADGRAEGGPAEPMGSRREMQPSMTRDWKRQTIDKGLDGAAGAGGITGP